jgi:hypothetical protein
MIKQKELNQELFGFKSLNDKVSEEALREATEALKSLPQVPLHFESGAGLANDHHLIQLKAEIDENNQTQNLRIERLQTSLSRLEKIHNSFVQDVSAKYQQVLLKLTDQKKYDEKVHDLIERHSQLLKGYEVRMNQLQKLLSIKEQEMSELQAHLNETKMELMRLRRL